MRVKTGTTRRKRHKKIIKLAKGYRMTKSRLYKVAHEAVMHAGEYAFHGRKRRKRDLRRLWIVRINAAVREHSLSYSQFIKKLDKANINLNRQMLSYLALFEPKVFEAVVDKINEKKLNRIREKVSKAY
ncbi:MAG: 50S ribosomal protein L20 [Candidatus Shapirobacteria bacterium]